MRPGEQQLRRGERADAGLIEQLRRELAGQVPDLGCELVLFGCQLLDPAGEAAERLQGAAQLDVGVNCRTDCCEAPE